MNSKLGVLLATGAAATLVSACGHDDNTPMAMPPPASMSQSLDTAAVLAMAKASSETTDPITVNDGALVLTDTSETTEPISVDSM